MKLINAVTIFLVTTKYFVAADLEAAIGTSDNTISQGVQVEQNDDNLLQAVGQVRLRGTTHQQPSFLDESKSCRGNKDIPFMITNVKLSLNRGEYYWGFHSNNYENEMKFLKDVRYCPDAGWFGAYRIYGQVLTKEEFKKEVEDYVKMSSKIDHVFYNIHGFNVDPKNSFSHGYDNFDFNNTGEEKKGSLVIPINWRNNWGKLGSSYEYDRNISAIRAGKQLAEVPDVFDTTVPVSIMCHSMGNYVFRVMAQNVEKPKEVFQNLFMVAADARMDMFSTDFNPGAPRSKKALVGDSNTKVNVDFEAIDIPKDELKENGGLAITKVTKHTHVVWNRGDHALLIREAFQIGWGDNIRKALGKYGDQSEQLTTLDYFKSRVTFHDYSSIIEHFGIEHNYQWMDPLKELYSASESVEYGVESE